MKESVRVQSQVALVIVIHRERFMCTLNTWTCFLGIIMLCKPTLRYVTLDVISCNDTRCKKAKLHCILHNLHWCKDHFWSAVLTVLLLLCKCLHCKCKIRIDQACKNTYSCWNPHRNVQRHPLNACPEPDPNIP